MARNIIFHQLFEPESSTYTYLIADKTTREAIIIDPVIETVDRDIHLINELGLKLQYTLDTHVHADHITAASELRARLKCKSAISEDAHVDCIDVPLKDGQEIKFGSFTIKALSTPGHTDSCMSFYMDGMVFTGDALLIRGTGRTDFQQGSANKLYHSINDKLFKLPDDTIVYPGHDYRGQTSSCIEMEKKYNPRVGGNRSEEEFVKIMSELKLANPKKIHEAVPANLMCGNKKSNRVLRPQMVDGIPEVTPEDVKYNLGKVKLIDVRQKEEFNNEYGHIPGAVMFTLGPELVEFLEKGDRSEEMAFVCRSGGRSGQATKLSLDLGYKFTANLVGGMIRWNELKYPVERK